MIKYDVKKINNKNVRMIPKKMEKKFPEELNIVISKMKERISREIPDKGFFRNFAEDFENKDKNIFARAVSLNIEKDENIEGNALLLVSALHPSMNIDASTMLFCGSRDEILKFMNGEKFSEKVMDEISKLSNSLKQV